MAYEALISPAQLQELLAGEPGARAVVFDARFSLGDTEYGQRAYNEAHIPGAFYVHLDRDLSGPVGPTTGRHPLPDVERLAALMRQHGVSDSTQVVVYDDAGGMFAARLWWMLRWLGHRAVAVLDGGWPAWQKQGGAQTSQRPAVATGGSFVPRPDPSFVLTAEQIQSGLADGSITLCDARAPERYRGDVEPIDKVAGHVPGAVNVPFSNNLTGDGHFKPVDQLRRIHSTYGERRPVHMCGSGVTACHNLLAAVAAGLPMPKLYAGSWSEWITDPNRPVARG